MPESVVTGAKSLSRRAGRNLTSIRYSPSANDYSILAEALPFTVATVQPKNAGNSGQVTFTVQGAAFDTNTTFRLSGATNSRAAQMA